MHVWEQCLYRQYQLQAALCFGCQPLREQGETTPQIYMSSLSSSGPPPPPPGARPHAASRGVHIDGLLRSVPLLV